MIKTYGVYNPHFEEVRDVGEIYEYFKDKESIEVDTETNEEGETISLQLGNEEDQFFIDCREIDIKLFKELLESKLCILQNAKYDYKKLKEHGIIIERIYDTMLAEVVLYCGYTDWGYGLDVLVKRYLEVDMSKLVRA